MAELTVVVDTVGRDVVVGVVVGSVDLVVSELQRVVRGVVLEGRVVVLVVEPLSKHPLM